MDVADTEPVASGPPIVVAGITDLLDGDIEEAEEGRIVSALHRRYEWDKKIVQKAKKWTLAVGAPCL